MIVNKWDTGTVLKTSQDIIDYLAAAFETGDMTIIGKAMQNVAKIRGISDIAKQMGVSQIDVNKMLSDIGNAEFRLVLKFIDAIGACLCVKAKA